MPKPLLHESDGTQIVAFTMAQRLRILFGFRMLVQVAIRSQHSPGAFSPTMQLALTPHKKLVPACEDSASMVKVFSGVPEKDENLELQIDRLREQRAAEAATKAVRKVKITVGRN